MVRRPELTTLIAAVDGADLVEQFVVDALVPRGVRRRDR